MATASSLLIAHAITKFGSKGWEFATPLLLLTFSAEGSLFAPTLFGLVIFLLKFLIGPAAGLWMDRSPRLPVIKQGIGLQTLGVAAALCVYALRCWLQAAGLLSATSDWSLIAAMITCGTVEAIGALVSSVAVKKDWVPSVWDADEPSSAAELAAINTWMANIDLIAEIAGPLSAGIALYTWGEAAGFVLIGVVNVLSFGVEYYLLLSVYYSAPALAAPKPVPASSGSGGGRMADLLSAWPLFMVQPSGVPLLVASYALLYFTVLSPHGVVLTAYLQTRGVPPPALATFRAAGALSGVAGMGAFRWLSGKLKLRALASGHLWFLAIAVAVAASSFHFAAGVDGLSAPMVCTLPI